MPCSAVLQYAWFRLVVRSVGMLAAVVCASHKSLAIVQQTHTLTASCLDTHCLLVCSHARPLLCPLHAHRLARLRL